MSDPLGLARSKVGRAFRLGTFLRARQLGVPMHEEPQPVSPLDAWRASDSAPHAGRADIARLGSRGPNPLELHPEELDVLRRLRASEGPLEALDPIWDELETLGLVELQTLRLVPGGPQTRCGMLTWLGRRYRTDE
jgi:hypothetical protein